MGTKINAKIIADSLSPSGSRITTYLLTYPRFIHGELMTHRMFSRNSASSRAIPFKKMVKMAKEDPFIPIAWQKDHKGMQGTEYLEIKPNVFGPVNGWLEARDKAVELANYLNELGVTKQLCNRLLEPFMWHTVIITATEFENFFALRCPAYYDGKVNHRSIKDYLKANDSDIEKYPESYWKSINQSQAEIHIQALAESMWDAMNESIPEELKSGEWHIPFGEYIDENPKVETELELLSNKIHFTSIADSADMEMLKVKIATAMCAKLSYNNHGSIVNFSKDLDLHDMLLRNKHMSPFEHCARVMSDVEYSLCYYKGSLTDKNSDKSNSGWCRNFKGFIQYRDLVE